MNGALSAEDLELLRKDFSANPEHRDQDEARQVGDEI